MGKIHCFHIVFEQEKKTFAIFLQFTSVQPVKQHPTSTHTTLLGLSFSLRLNKRKKYKIKNHFTTYLELLLAVGLRRV